VVETGIRCSLPKVRGRHVEQLVMGEKLPCQAVRASNERFSAFVRFKVRAGFEG
jgi:hypothetical protein